MKKRLNLVFWIMTPLVIIALSVYIKTQNNAVAIFDGLTEGLFYSQTSKANQSKEEIITSSNVTQINKIISVNPAESIEVKSSFARGNTEIMVYPGGQPIGVKLNIKGVLVVALSDIDSTQGKIASPAATSGVQIGDSILKINDVEISQAEDVARFVNRENNSDITLKIQRKNNLDTFDIKVKPVVDSKDGKRKIGLWVRDSTAGVGTLTLYDDKTKKFAALGHPITDADTGTILSVSNGIIVSSNIVSIKKGTRGNPGELRGLFIDENKIKGQIIKNTECGIFGNGTQSLINSKFNKPMKIGLRDEIKEGKAEILTTINGSEPELFQIEIQKLLPQNTSGSKSMIIKITDPKLLEKTGGIVQGMSGSPIIQNNKIIGAVTHVLINKPDMGYGIYIEWMLKDAGILSK
ncbi:SpoIVB peptidase [Clostridium sp. CF012]|uniref:SpoIVB peptidase n=1 Tax=Clostridium sp. CF012 TaxID=2843319 RepID=UPI001C0BD51A|nr:SpoIVB peptidase [Clostridium sp. CF012]MBU3142177.1 SpoIVB peptidase [Clostridium sp. CF012]